MDPIDNITTGAIIQQIIEYVGPKCSHGSDRLSVVNKYFNKTIQRMCHLEKLCNRWVCKIHYSDYVNLKITHDAIQGGGRWIHFDSKERAVYAKPFVLEQFIIYGQCCGGRGWRIQKVIA